MAEWGYRLDLATWGSSLACASTLEVEALRVKVLASDYMGLGVGSDFSALSAKDVVNQIKQIRVRLLSIPSERASDSCKTWLSLTKRALQVPLQVASKGIEQDVRASLLAKYADSISSGELRSENLEIASKVAAGQLDGDVVVGSLLSRLVAQDRKARGCLQRTGSSLGSDAATEFLLTIGRRNFG